MLRVHRDRASTITLDARSVLVLQSVASDLATHGGLSHAEVAVVLGVSKQRVSQLVAPPRPPAA